jgi:hypothetical protein
MLPGFRFLFAAIVLCMSVLVFGLGAAALLRAAHEDFASNPSWRTPPEPRFAQQEATKTVLAVLSLQPSPTEPAAAPKVPEADAAVTTGASTVAAPSPSPEPETTAALSPPDVPPAEGAKTAPSTTEAPAQTQTSQIQREPVPVRTEAQAEAPVSETKTAAAEETKTAAADNASPSASEPASSPQPSPTPQQITAPATSSSDQAATRIATLGGPAVIIDPPAAATASHAMLDRSQINKRPLAELAQQRATELANQHAKELRRLAARRARMARQAATVQQQADNPFAPHPLPGPTPAR